MTPISSILLHAWFSHNGLSLNPSKSDAVLFSTRQRRQSLAPLSHVNVSDTEVKLSDSLITLGVILDNDLTFNNHIISHLCISSLFHLRSLLHIRPCLTVDMATPLFSLVWIMEIPYSLALLKIIFASYSAFRIL